MRNIAIIGATGSIGRQAIDIIERNPDRFRLMLISAHSDLQSLVETANRLQVPYVAFSGKEIPSKTDFTYPCELIYGENALCRAAEQADYDIFLNAVVGISALQPTLIAMEKGARIALSNKEMLVCAGSLVMDRAKKLSAEIIPVDSEHSAIFQCLFAGQASEIDSLIITSSGGAFRDIPIDKLDKISPSDALFHPNWKMGRKITIDCATMVNKGFEVIEASHLFSIPIEQIETRLHRESIVHSMVRFCDGSIIAQLSSPDMRLPIQYAFTYPERISSPVSPLPTAYSLSFDRIDENRYPCFPLLIEAGKRGGLYPAALLAADTVLVPAFLMEKITYFDFPKVFESILNEFSFAKDYSVSDVFFINNEIEKYTRKVVNAL